MPRDISCKRGNIVKSRNTQFEARRKSANSFFFRPPPPLFFPVERQGGRKKKKKRSTAVALRGVYEGIYERPAGNYSARYQSQYQDYESFYANPLSLLLLFFVFIVTAVKEGLRKLPEFLSSPPAPPPSPPARGNSTVATIRDDFHSPFLFPFFFGRRERFPLSLSLARSGD